MIDGCGRQIDHLRLSLTDRCNLACRYCVPAGAPAGGRMIDATFAVKVVRWLAGRHGIRHVRLTGGEPLLYGGLVPLVRSLSNQSALHEITLTTNAQALAHMAHALRAAGLTRLNVSLDTLDPDRFARLTRGGDLARTLSGIEAAVDAGLTPVKINVVAQSGLNEGELADLAAWGLSRGCVVRFLEVMPIGPLAHVSHRHLVPASEILRRLSERFSLRAIRSSIGQPAVDYAATQRRHATAQRVGRPTGKRIDHPSSSILHPSSFTLHPSSSPRHNDLSGVIGLIAPTTRPFCSRCRRLRLTSHGELVPCLHDRRKASLMPAWDGSALDIEAADAILSAAIAAKQAVGPQNQAAVMVSLGG